MWQVFFRFHVIFYQLNYIIILFLYIMFKMLNFNIFFFNAVEMASSEEKRVEDKLWYPIMVAEQVCSVVDETDLFKL